VTADVTDVDARLAGAARLARQGRYDDARGALTELGGRDSDDPVLLDLLARVYAQQGELAEADDCWARAIAVGADQPAARAGRRRIAALQARRYRPGARGVAGAAAVVLLAGAGFAGTYLAGQDEPADPAVLATLRDNRAAQDDLARQLADLRERLDRVTEPAEVVDELDGVLAGSGLVVRRDGDVLTVAFPVGVFTTGTDLSDGGRRALADLGRRLGPFGGRVDVTVVGHTDNGVLSPNGRYADHTSLGLARAAVAGSELAARAGLPMTDLSLTSTGIAEPPFPNTTHENRARNRTVTLRLSAD